MSYKWSEGVWEGAWWRCIVYKWMVHWFFYYNSAPNLWMYETSRCINTAGILVQTVWILVRSPTFNVLQDSSISVGYTLSNIVQGCRQKESIAEVNPSTIFGCETMPMQVQYYNLLSWFWYFYNSIFLFPRCAISYDIAQHGCYCTGVIERAQGLRGILATRMCFN